MENLIKRFVKYAKVHTTSNEDSETVPSTEIQKNLGKILVEDLKEIGLSDAYMDDKGYVYATLKANTDKKLKKNRIYSSYGYITSSKWRKCKPTNT